MRVCTYLSADEDLAGLMLLSENRAQDCRELLQYALKTAWLCGGLDPNCPSIARRWVRFQLEDAERLAAMLKTMGIPVITVPNRGQFETTVVGSGGVIELETEDVPADAEGADVTSCDCELVNAAASMELDIEY